MVQDKVYEKTNLTSGKIQPIVRVYGKRWLILLIYILYAALSTSQWVEYSIITNLVMKYYHVTASEVDWTSMIFMVMWPILVFPASFVIDRMGLRVAGLIGASTTAIGATIKLYSIGQGLFHIVMIGQTIIAISQIFILSLPPKIAVTWFLPNEISTVCSLGIFGMTFGSALGFVIPPMVVKDHDDIEAIGTDLRTLCWILAVTTIPLALTVFFYFPKHPLHCPTVAQFQERINKETVTVRVFTDSLKVFLQNKAFLLHTVSYGCCMGIFSAIGTLLNQFVLNYFPDAQEDAGRMGLVMIIVGMIGSALIGILLDKTHKFKETAIVVFVLCTLSMIGFLFALEVRSKLMVYLAIGIFGFFLNAYMPVGVEFAAELTFPSPGSTMAGVLMATSQILAVALTMLLGHINITYGTFYAICMQIGVLCIGTILTCFTPNRLRRQEAFGAEDDIKKLSVGKIPQIVTLY